MRQVYLKGEPEFKLADDQLLEIIRPLYGLADSGDYWHGTILKHLKSDLSMQITACDLSLFFRQVQSTLQGLVPTHVDDTLSTVNKLFEDETQVTARKFDAKPRTYKNLTFTGFTIKTNPDG